MKNKFKKLTSLLLASIMMLVALPIQTLAAEWGKGDTVYAAMIGDFVGSDGSFIHSDYLSDSKVAQTAAPATKKAETPKPATTTKKQESKPKSIYEYPFDLEAIKQVIVDDAVNNYGLKNLDDPSWVPEGSTWNVPLVISYDMHPNVIKRNVEDEAGANFRVAQMKKGDYFKIYIRDISEDMDIRDENGKLTKAYAIYFLRG